MRAAAGFSANIATAGLATGVRNAANEAAANGGPGPPGSDQTYTKGALVAAASTPGIAPFVSARVGIGDRFEGGLAYTGRGARVDVRRSFDRKNFSLSLGIGGSGVFYSHSEGSVLPAVELGDLHGYGADIPLLAGWTFGQDMYQVWVGARTGWEHVNIDLLTSEPRSVTLGVPPISLSAERFFAGAVAGLAVGFRHIHVALELDIAYQSIVGTYNQTQSSINGISLAPATASWWDF